MGMADVKTLFCLGVLLLGATGISEKAEATSPITTKKAPASAEVICSYARCKPSSSSNGWLGCGCGVSRPSCWSDGRGA
jgi:hypothetical protein